MPRPGPRRVAVAVKVLPERIERLDVLAATAGGSSRSDIARLGVELAASGEVARRAGRCPAHDGEQEAAMYVLTLPGGEFWFCERTQHLVEAPSDR